ncbi:hypothetical protein IJD44_04080 [bacterium]|nr:hypothetical protein [bacterium]
MKISSSFNKNDRNISSPAFKAVPPNPRYIPEFVGKIGKYAGEYIDSPEQRLFLALATIAFKPLIDLKYADEDKKVDTAIKSLAKGIAGGLTGVAIRSVFLAVANKYIGFAEQLTGDGKLKPRNNILSKLFLTDNICKTLSKESRNIADKSLKKYLNSLGSIGAIVFMLAFSNSKVDVPLTNDIQDLFSGVIKEDKTWLKSLKDVKDNRVKKISTWYQNKKAAVIKFIEKTKKIIKITKDEQPVQSKGDK